MKLVCTERAEHESEIFRHLCELLTALANSDHPGRRYIEHPLDKFKPSPEYTCLTFNALGRSVTEYAERYQGGRLLEVKLDQLSVN
jgi:hypothetical protein